MLGKQFQLKDDLKAPKPSRGLYCILLLNHETLEQNNMSMRDHSSPQEVVFITDSKNEVLEKMDEIVRSIPRENFEVKSYTHHIEVYDQSKVLGLIWGGTRKNQLSKSYSIHQYPSLAPTPVAEVTQE